MNTESGVEFAAGYTFGAAVAVIVVAITDDLFVAALLTGFAVSLQFIYIGWKGARG